MSLPSHFCCFAFLLLAVAPALAFAGGGWPLWAAYVDRFMTDEGRVVDPQAGDHSTSEGQAYGLFFALVANDRPAFDRLLAWTEANLADGDLGKNLPSWLWARGDDDRWGVQDPNAAADADVWMAYTLLEAGEQWCDPALSLRGAKLAEQIVVREVRTLPGLGPMLLPGPRGFRPAPDVWQLNPSYLALQPLLGLASRLPAGPWAEIAANGPRVILESRLHGFAADWTAYRNDQGFLFDPLPVAAPTASYDAIRVYLWAGMLAEESKGRSELLAGLGRMKDYVGENGAPPAVVGADGGVQDPNGSVGFSAALLPFVQAHGDEKAAKTLRNRLSAEYFPEDGLYTADPGYYDHNLVLFGLGWSEGRFAFEANGRLRTPWKDSQ